MDLKGSQTENNLKAAFAGESQANRRYLYFAAKADVEGYNDVSAVFRSTAEGETGHAHGHLEYLEASGDPATGLPIGPTSSNLKAAIAGEKLLVDVKEEPKEEKPKRTGSKQADHAPASEAAKEAAILAAIQGALPGLAEKLAEKMKKAS